MNYLAGSYQLYEPGCIYSVKRVPRIYDDSVRVYIRNLTKNNVKIFMSYDGKSGSADNTSTSVPDDLFARHIYVNSGHSPFKKLKSKSVGTDNKAMLYDSLYINY